ncbi:MAG: glucuronate isomerase, partial [Opitutaceae bacterium]|nr:glucuronate isomerase [Opitutaceae bacterium]
MPAFIHDDFLLHTDAARDLYHHFAKAEPIYDYHCHLPQALIASNHRFADLSEIWLGGDHYKWRAMRANGVSERVCTGDAPPREKFDAWCAAVPNTLGNPLYHWSHLELARYFGITDLISPKSADAIWQQANAKLAGMRVHDILAANKVAVICTTDDPADPLADHAKIAQLGIRTKVYPTFRPDKALGVNAPAAYNAWLEKLGGEAKVAIRTFDDLLTALKQRHADFHAAGGRLSDHGLESALAEPCTHAEATAIFAAARAGRAASPADWAKFGSFLMLEFGRWDAKAGWTKQLHLGALRNNNTRLLKALGPDTGFDSIGDFNQARALSNYLNALDATGELPRTVLYNLNPADN